MLEENEFQTTVDAPTNGGEVVNEDIEALQDEAAIESAPEPETTEATPSAPTPEDLQAQADKAAVFASGKFHLDNLYKQRVNETHAITANTVAAIMVKTERAENWLADEVVALWREVEQGAQALL